MANPYMVLDTDFFQTPAQTLVIAVNTVGVMGKGQAAQAKALYPDLYREYKELCRMGELYVGYPTLVTAHDKQFVLFPTKRHWREKSRMHYIETGMKVLAQWYIDWNITSLALPALGCGLGGLEWQHVKTVMKRYIDQINVPVYVYARGQE